MIKNTNENRQLSLNLEPKNQETETEEEDAQTINIIFNDLPEDEQQGIKAMLGQCVEGHVSSVDEISSRKIALWGKIDEALSQQIVQGMVHLSLESPNTPIELWVNSPGGSLLHTLAIYDVMQYVTCPVHTIGLGEVSSGAVLLLAGGEPGHRYLSPNVRCMLHQVVYGGRGSFADMNSLHAEADVMGQKWIKLLAKHSKLSKKEIVDLLRDNTDLYFSAKKTISLGFADLLLK